MPGSWHELQAQLRRLEGRGYGAYRDIAGSWRFAEGEQLQVDHVQADPFASPSRLRVVLPWSLPAHLRDKRHRLRGAAAYLGRQAQRAIQSRGRRRGSGRSGELYVDAGGQQLLERTAVFLSPETIEIRLSCGLPAANRRILGGVAWELLDHLVQALANQLCRPEEHAAHLRQWADLAEDQVELRGQLAPLGLVAFVPDGARLPRQSGVSDLPLSPERVVPFTAPPELRVTLRAPRAGYLTGMGIPEGVTLIVGGGYHGKSTLLRALERGVYDHIPGDGREYLVTRPRAVKVRAEDGRSVAGVDISPFIGRLPGGEETQSFYTQEASGSTSQAANIMEALEGDCDLLLMDEDTSATNFLIRDARMQRLVIPDEEPIIPLIDRVRDLRALGVSTIMVMGGSGDYFSVADQVIRLHAYRASDATARAREISAVYPTDRITEHPGGRLVVSPRVPLPSSINLWYRGRPRAAGRGLSTIVLGEDTLDLAQVEQLVCPSQTRAIALFWAHARQHYLDGRRTLPAILELVYGDWRSGGWERLSPHVGHPGDLALPRQQEVLAALNRLRPLRVLARGGCCGEERNRAAKERST